MLQVCEEKTGFPVNSEITQKMQSTQTLFCHRDFPVVGLARRDTDGPCPLECVTCRRTQGPGRARRAGRTCPDAGGPLVQTAKGGCDGGRRL